MSILFRHAKSDNVQYHLGLSKDMIKGAEYVLLSEEPNLSEDLAKAFDPCAKFLADSRGHKSYLASFHGYNILVCSSGLGAANIGISIEELAVMGLKYYLRVGTCRSIQANIEIGDVVISTAGVRLEGTSSDYAPIEYPSVASFEFTTDMIEGAKNACVTYHIGITASADTLWQAQERYDSYTGYLLRSKRQSIEEWRALNVSSFDFETSALFVMASVMRLHAACICGVIAKRVELEKISLNTTKVIDTACLKKVVVDGIYQSLKRRGLIQ